MFKDRTDGKIKDYTNLLLHVDGGCEPKNPGGVATAGWVLYDPKRRDEPLVEEGTVVKDGGPLATNNYGEYCALCLALKWLVEQGWRGDLTIKADSQLLVEQVSGHWQVKAEHLKPLRQLIWDRLEALNLHRLGEDDPLPDEGKGSCQIVHVRRHLNEYANDLCRAAYKEYKQGK